MKKYVKAVLYSYPLLKMTEEGYEEHIKNVACMSHASKVGAERTAEYLAEEILRARRFSELRQIAEKVLGKMSEKEKFLLEIRYFRRRKKLKEFMEKLGEDGGFSKRNFFRKQHDVLKKAEGLFERYGLSKERFDRDFANFESMEIAMRFVDRVEDLTKGKIK